MLLARIRRDVVVLWIQYAVSNLDFLCENIHFLCDIIQHMEMDVLSSALAKLKLKTYVSGVTDVGGKWAVSFPAYEGFKLQVILKGECWIELGESKTRHCLRAGDCSLMTRGQAFVMATDLTAKIQTYAEVMEEYAKKGTLTQGGGGDLLLIGVHLQFEGHLPKIMFGDLPPLIHIEEHMEQAAILRWTIERFRAEFRGQQTGRSLMLSHLAPIMLLQILRIYLASTKTERNWLSSLSDPRLSKAIEAIHFEYHNALSLDDLAQIAGMSRSGFALNFKKHVGIPPMDYLTNWRMDIACELLESRTHSVGEVAFAVGYESESAFSFAFNRVIGCRPGFYQKSRCGLQATALTGTYPTSLE